MIVIKNLKSEKPKHEWDVVVDRSSVFGNPFHMKNESERDMVCEKYEEYFKGKVIGADNVSSELKIALDELVTLYCKHKRLNLFCWCVPKRCHAEIIMHYVDSVANNA